jgi:hypothetical protein
MHDPFLPIPPLLSTLSAPIANTFNLTTLPLHIHEVLIAFFFYHAVNTYGSPWISRRLFPTIYSNLNKRTKLNWDVHVVSLVQSCLINALAIWVIWTDEERSSMDWRGRVWGYTGAGGMIQGFAAGYFLWDLCVSTLHVGIFGWGMLAHAIAALVVFSLGFVGFPPAENVKDQTAIWQHERNQKADRLSRAHYSGPLSTSTLLPSFSTSCRPHSLTYTGSVTSFTSPVRASSSIMEYSSSSLFSAVALFGALTSPFECIRMSGPLSNHLDLLLPPYRTARRQLPA